MKGEKTMSAKQTPMLLGRFVEHQDHFNPLPTADAQWAIQNPKIAITFCVTAIQGRPKEPAPERACKVLRPVAPKIVEPRPFKADETFFSKTSGVKMVPHGSNFTSWFTGKVEEDVQTGDLVPFALTQSAYDNEIIADLGGEEKAETTLGEIWRLMQRQANGEDGVLLTNGYANIFYVLDNTGALRAVDVVWYGGGWHAYASALDVGRWSGGQAFSRNS
jgi:hypothetical protein